MRTARFPEVLDQGGAENIAIGFDKTEDEKETRTAKFRGKAQNLCIKVSQASHSELQAEVLGVVPSTVPDQGGAENSAKHCQTLPTSGSKTATSGKSTATSGSKAAISAIQLRKVKRRKGSIS